jgi:predicted DNA-binding transcriptional regulator YafY
VDEPFIENTRYDFKEYFEDIIGINRGKDKPPEEITLWFAPDKAPYIQTKPIHGSQKVKKQDEEGLVITIEVIVNYELKSLLWSFGDEVKVLSPEWLDNELLKKRYK